MSRTGQDGYTLVEVLTAIVLLASLMVLTAGALRHFWFVQTLDASTDEAVTQLRKMQTRVTAESHPRVYGVRFRKGSETFGLIRYEPNGAGVADDTCVEFESRSLNTGVFNATVRVSSTTTAVPDSSEATVCRAQLSGVSANDVFVFFYARGTATAGTLRIEQPNLDRGNDITVSALTGRVERD